MGEKRLKKKKRYRILLFLILIVLFDCVLIKYLQRIAVGNADRYAEKIYDELVCFPIPQSCSEKDMTCSYTDSWLSERTFGGERQHEGCDIMTSENQRGIYPVVSMTDGVVESIGWLELGGYRIGIRSDSGIYYYYAHMESYAEGITEGTQVDAGEFLGFVGDSGYGSEGTTGKFAVHLHVGIYVPSGDGTDQAVNPYPFLQYLENRCLISDYQKPGKDH